MKLCSRDLVVFLCSLHMRIDMRVRRLTNNRDQSFYRTSAFTVRKGQDRVSRAVSSSDLISQIEKGAVDSFCPMSFCRRLPVW